MFHAACNGSSSNMVLEERSLNSIFLYGDFFSFMGDDVGQYILIHGDVFIKMCGCFQLFMLTNLQNVFQARPLSSDSLAFDTHSSICFCGSRACMANEAFIRTQSVWAFVARFCRTLSNMLAASSGVLPPYNSSFREIVNPRSEGR